VTANEFPRPFRLDTIGDTARTEVLAADGAERAALARRFGLIAIERLGATATLSADGDVITATGALDTAVVQACAVTGDALPVAVRVPFAIRFVPAATADADEIELTEDEGDTVEHDGQCIDLGEAVAQSMALALDPYLRGPNADAHLAAAGVLGEGEGGPFAILKGLK
jgi:uncharacterized metal-binding protein YceD (DUF177 family)